MSTSQHRYYGNLLTEALQCSASEDGHGITFILGEEDEGFFPYSQLYQESLRILYSLQAQGLKPGDELVIQLSNIIEFVHVFWACLLGGIIPVPLSTYRIEYHVTRLANIWRRLKSPRIIMSEELAEEIERLGKQQKSAESIYGEIDERAILTSRLSQLEARGTIHKANPGDIAFLQFTSGSTGNPKGVILTHENLMANCHALINRLSLTSKDTTLSWMPVTHDMGLIVYHMTPLITGCNQVLMTTELFAQRPQLWMEKTHEYAATHLGGPNFSYHHFLKHFAPEKAAHWSLDRVRVIINGAEPISIDLVNRFLDTLAPYGLRRQAMMPGYGLAEASVAVTTGLLDEEFRAVSVDRKFLAVGEAIQELEAGKPNSVTFVDVGCPLDDCKVRIVDDDRKPLGDGSVGHIQVRGKNVTRGYYNDPSATSEVIMEDGWLDTGDLGFMRRGRLVVTGRTKDIIFVYGQNYYAHDIERIVQEVEGIELNTVAACGSFNRELNKDEIVLFVKFKGKTEDFIPLAQKLKQHINQRLGLEVDHVIPVEGIPKTTSGKLQRYELRNQYERGCFQSVLETITLGLQTCKAQKLVVLPETDLERKLVDIWARILQLPSDQISTDDPFLSIGGTSFKAMQMLYMVEEGLGLKLGERILVECKTVKEMAAFIENEQFSAPSMGPDSGQDQTKANM